jgi:hypothetical protein
MNKMVTAKIVKIVAVYAADGASVPQADTGVVGMTGTVDVQPLVNLQDGVGNNMPHGIVHGIPFGRTQGGANAIISDPQVGDIGIMVVADRDSSSVKTNRAQAPPGSRRTYNIADGMYVCSLLTQGDPKQWVRFRDDGLEFVDANGNKIVTTPQGTTLTDSNGNTTAWNAEGITHTPVSGLFKVIGNAEFTGMVHGNTAGIAVGLTTHTHMQGDDSHGDTEVPTDPPTPGT